MPHFVRFSRIRFTSDCVENRFHTNHRYELDEGIFLLNMDQVISIAKNSPPKLGIQTADIYVSDRADAPPFIVAAEEMDRWLDDNPQFGGRSTGHLIGTKAKAGDSDAG